MNDSHRPTGPSMLLRFAGENVRSFRGAFEMSLQATTMAEPSVVRSIAWRNDGDKVDVLPVAGVFGSNASGKSNLLFAMADMRRIVATSFQHGTADTPIPRIPFLLTSDAVEHSSRFEIVVVIDGVKHEYGFECDDMTVRSEWAYHFPNGRRALLFAREGQKVKVGSEDTATGRATMTLLRPNALFLSTAAATGFSPAVRLARWITDNLLLAEANNREHRQTMTVGMLRDPKLRERCLRLLRAADIGIVDAHLRQPDDDFSERFKKAMRVLNGVDPDDESVEIPNPVGIELLHQGRHGAFPIGPGGESLGTEVWLGLIGPVIQALADGSVLLLDELDSSLHPVLVREVIRLFQDPETNPRRAQVIFNAFDLSVLSQRNAERLLGRDQIWFTEKDFEGSSRLYPLTDFSPRKDEAIDDRYLRGRYGAVPIISEAEFDAAVDFETV